MARCYVILIMMLLISPAVSHGVNLIEVDLDGSFGNGADTLAVPEGTPVTITIWFDGEVTITAFILETCGLDSMNITQINYLVPGNWSTSPPIIQGDCVKFEAVTFNLFTLFLPSAVAEIKYTANLAPGLYPIVVDPNQSPWFDISGSEVIVDTTITGYLLVTEPTSVSEGNWGDLKRLFR